MEKKTQTTRRPTEVSPSDEEVRLAIGYLDRERADSAVTVLIAVFLVLFIVIPLLGLFYFR